MLGQSRLVLYPTELQLQLPLETLANQLHQQAILDQPLPSSVGEQCYLVGARFFDAFLFLGCSPSIELAPSAQNPEQPFCYLQLESEPACRLVSGSNLKAVCPGCKKRLPPNLSLSRSGAGEPTIDCDQCGQQQLAGKIAWRKTAALSASRISLWNIFEGEAVPSDRLLALLEQLCGAKWRYSYISG